MRAAGIAQPAPGFCERYAAASAAAGGVSINAECLPFPLPECQNAHGVEFLLLSRIDARPADIRASSFVRP